MIVRLAQLDILQILPHHDPHSGTSINSTNLRATKYTIARLMRSLGSPLPSTTCARQLRNSCPDPLQHQYNKKAGVISGLFDTRYTENKFKSHRRHEDTRWPVPCMSPV